MCVAKEEDVPQVLLHVMTNQEEAEIEESASFSLSSNLLAVDALLSNSSRKIRIKS